MIKLNREAQLKQDRFLDLQERNDLLKTQIEYARKNNSIFVQKIEREQGRLSNLSALCANQQRLASASQQRMNALRLEWFLATQKHDNIEQKVNGLKDCRAKLQTEIDRCKMTIETEGQQLKILVEKMHVKNEDCDELEKQAVESQKKIAAVKQKTNEIALNIANLDKKIEIVMELIEKKKYD